MRKKSIRVIKGIEYPIVIQCLTIDENNTFCRETIEFLFETDQYFCIPIIAKEWIENDSTEERLENILDGLI